MKVRDLVRVLANLPESSVVSIGVEEWAVPDPSESRETRLLVREPQRIEVRPARGEWEWRVVLIYSALEETGGVDITVCERCGYSRTGLEIITMPDGAQRCEICVDLDDTDLLEKQEDV